MVPQITIGRWSLHWLSTHERSESQTSVYRYIAADKSSETRWCLIWTWSLNHRQRKSRCYVALFALRLAWQRLSNPMILASHRALESNWLFILSDEESVQRKQRVSNRWSLHLERQNRSYVLTRCKNTGNIMSKVFSRHLQQTMAYPGHRTGFKLTPPLEQGSRPSHS